MTTLSFLAAKGASIVRSFVGAASENVRTESNRSALNRMSPGMGSLLETLGVISPKRTAQTNQPGAQTAAQKAPTATRN